MLITPAVATRIELADAHHTAEYAQLRAEWFGTKTDILHVGQALAIYTGSDMPLNRAVALGMSGPVSPEDFESVENFYSRHNLPAKIDFCPYADERLLRRLASRGYLPHSLFTTLVRPLPAEDLAANVSNIDIRLVDEQSLETWVRTISQGFIGMDRIPEGDLNPEFATIAYHKPSTYCFLAHIDNEPVGGGAIRIETGLATLFSASVRTKFRRRGVQKALMIARLQFATERGCNLATVLATPGSASERNIQRVGFQIAYTKVVFKKS